MRGAIRKPHYYIEGNLVWASGPEDGWAAFKLDGQSYPGLSAGRKIDLKKRLEDLAYEVETDFQVIRTARQWSAESYVERALSTVDRKRGHPEAFATYLERQRRELAARQVVRPEIYFLVRLRGPWRGSTPPQRLGEIGRGFARRVGLSEPGAMGKRERDELGRLEYRMFERVYQFAPCERARSQEVFQLIASAYTRGLGEPRIDDNWLPQALYVEPREDAEDGQDEEGPQPRFEPYQHDLMRLHNARVEPGWRHLKVYSELGMSYQAMLVVGALPERARFPGRDVELMFAPLEVGFPVDAVFTAEWRTNRQARALARKRKVDADQQAKEEAHSEHGPSVQTHEKTYAARELEARLEASDKPPLLRSALTLCVGAASEDELEERIERLRAGFGRIELHQTLGEQHALFLGTLPAIRFPLRDYQAHLLPEQFGAMVPSAISHAGSAIGPYLGRTLGGAGAPIQFDLAEACKSNRPSAVYLSGSLGSGKTMALQTMLYAAFLQGSHPIVDVDPKGDHALDKLPGVAERMERIELGPDERYRGLLDPMRIASDDRREGLTYSYLNAVLPPPVPPEAHTELRRAVALVNDRGGRTTGEVVEELARGTEAAKRVASALEVHLEADLAKLGYSQPGDDVAEVGEAQVISIRIRNLTLPIPGTTRSELQEDERLSQAVLQLIAAYAMRLCLADTRTHACLALDEAWTLLADTSGQGYALIARVAREGRALNTTAILASQIVGDAESLEALVGSYFAFGVETEQEASRALELLRLDTDDSVLHQRLMGFRKGRCYYRDIDGRVVPMKIDPGTALLRVLDTTPQRDEGAMPRSGAVEEEAEPDEIAA